MLVLCWLFRVPCLMMQTAGINLGITCQKYWITRCLNFLVVDIIKGEILFFQVIIFINETNPL